MELITIPELIQTNYVESVEDTSNSFMQAMRIKFKNGLQLSIVRGKYTYGGDQGLYEIAILDKNDEFNDSLFDEEDQADTVLGYCDKDKVNHYINKIGSA